jgi:formiminotetrahydrofolate cyclodeaminase
MWLFAIDQATLFGGIAAFSTLLGIAMTVLSHISGAKNAAEKAQRETHQQLLEEQRLTEKLSKQLHELRLKYGEAEE